MNERCVQEQIAALEASLDWAPMILGDGQTIGSLKDSGFSSKGQMGIKCRYVPSVGAFSQPAAVPSASA
eukprot:2470929-Karenia_brevis.AAC.1